MKRCLFLILVALPLVCAYTATAQVLPGVFSVSATKKVMFSKGNLQYNVPNGTWRFAEHQWDYVGGTIDDEHDGNVSGSTNDNAAGPWIDLFGCSTWLEGGNPTNTSDDNGNYPKLAGKKPAIGAEWQSPTLEEWQYLISFGDNVNSTRTGKYGEGKVNGVPVVILLPDDWTYPSNLSAESTSAKDFTPEGSPWDNVYTADDWAKMEAAGAVFLPAAGGCVGTEVNFVGMGGNYWSQESDSVLGFYPGGVGTDNDSYSYYGRSVRLVREF